jgi:hypothetical protein
MAANIYAYTANKNPYPEFVSLNRHDDGRVSLTVRAPAKRVNLNVRETQGLHDTAGATIEVPLTEGVLQELREALMADAKARHGS